MKTFEWGETAESEAFFDRHPDFYPAFEKLIALVNKCFGRPFPEPHYGSDYILFSLGESCREDFLEIAFLAAHGYAAGAAKLFRGLYERAVALAYLVSEPQKTERLRKFGAIQTHKAFKDALKVVTEEEWDATMGPELTGAIARERFKAVEEEFQQTDCKKCGTKRLAISWDLDVASMVQKVGSPDAEYYLFAYTNANLELHTSLSSALREDDKDPDASRAKRHQKADYAVFCAAMLLVEVIHSENRHFAFNLGDELQDTEEAVARVWKENINRRAGSDNGTTMVKP
jgi:hypothetical protein